MLCPFVARPDKRPPPILMTIELPGDRHFRRLFACPGRPPPFAAATADAPRSSHHGLSRVSRWRTSVTERSPPRHGRALRLHPATINLSWRTSPLCADSSARSPPPPSRRAPPRCRSPRTRPPRRRARRGALSPPPPPAPRAATTASPPPPSTPPARP